MCPSKPIKTDAQNETNQLHHISLLTSTRIQKDRPMKQQVSLANYKKGVLQDRKRMHKALQQNI